MKKAYSYDKEGVLIGETEAQKDPLESEKQGKAVYLVPAMATLEPPPPKSEGKITKWNGSSWEVLPEPPSPEELKEEPTPPTPEEIAKTEKLSKAVSDLKKVKADSLTLEEMRTVISDILTIMIQE
jgi:hypothetical protein